MKRVVAAIGLVVTAAIASAAVAVSSSAAAPVNSVSAAPAMVLPSKPIVLAQADAAPPAAPADAAQPAAAPAAPAPAAPAAPAGGVDQFGLPLGPGHDLTVSKCSGCHDVTEFSGMRHNADDWGGIVGDMIGRGADINDADFKSITDYLATNLPPATPPAQ